MDGFPQPSLTNTTKAHALMSGNGGATYPNTQLVQAQAMELAILFGLAQTKISIALAMMQTP